MRTIVLHYHLYKNAGTSLDWTLQCNFGSAWTTREFETDVNASEVEAWIASEPGAIAFSSHSAAGPLPALPDLRVISVLLLRDPVERIRSVYRYERHSGLGWEGELARMEDFEGYVRARLARPGDRQCLNFHVSKLQSFVPGTEPEIERALRGLRLITVLGQVERFNLFLSHLKNAIYNDFPSFAPEPSIENASPLGEPINESPELLAELREINSEDYRLLEEAKRLIAMVPGGA